jgi:integrase
MTPRSFESRRRLVNRQLVPYFRGFSLRGVDGPQIREYLDAMRGVAGATRNRHQTVLSCIFRYAREAGMSDLNPALRVRRAREVVTPITVLDLATQDRLLTSIGEPQRTFFLLLLDTGLRLGEALDLEWQDLDLEKCTLYVRRSKAKRPRLVGLTRRLQTALHALRSTGSGAHARFVFPGARAAHYTLAWTWREQFKQAAKSLGYGRMRIHDLRHLHAVNLVRMGLDLPAVQAVLGHTTLISTLR